MKSTNTIFIFPLFLLILLFLFGACNQKDTATTPTTTTPSTTPDATTPTTPTPSNNDEVTQNGADKNSKIGSSSSKIEYTPNNPNLTMSLASKLIEISGLTYDTDTDRLLAINDEKGRLYQLNPENGDIIVDSKFGKKGDYEGIEIVDQSIYILESSGQLNVIEKNAEGTSSKIRTSLRSANDLEGLGYDKKTKSLLLACKGSSNILAKQKLKKTKAVYSLTIADGSLAEDPIFTVQDASLESFVNAHEEYDQMPIATKKKFLKRIKSFSPSAIAQHPTKDNFFILSSQGKSLVVIDRESKILSITFLNESIHRQPEGICFDNKSNMYISNEGKMGIAKIYKFYPSS